MILRRRISNETISTIKADPYFKEVYEIARKNSTGPVYLVGGRVYRTLIEKIHDCYVKANRSDWDFLVLGKVKSCYIPGSWTPQTNQAPPIGSKTFSPMSSGQISQPPRIRNAAIKANSMTLVNPTKGLVNKLKVDLIAIRDIVDGTKDGYHVGRYTLALKQEYGLKEYFDAVPLDIQCIACDLEANVLHVNRALKAIETKVLRINNPKGALPDLNIGPYIDRKAASLGFGYDAKIEKRFPCSCWWHLPYAEQSVALFNRGCQMPNRHR